MPPLVQAPAGPVIEVSALLNDAVPLVISPQDPSVDHLVACYYARPLKVL
jgi:hypothetical protein